MAKTGVFQIPRELKDEDKWFRYFTKRQAVIVVTALLADYRFILWANGYGLLLPAIVVATILTLALAGAVMVELPTEALFLSGGGITIEQWILRVSIHKRNRRVYTKNYEGEEGL